MEKPENCILVIFGASGDLTRRKLIPAIYDLFCQNILPERFAVLGASRTDMTDNEFRERMTGNIREFSAGDFQESQKSREFAGSLFYQSIQTSEAEEYNKVKLRLEEINAQLQTGGNYIYYLSTPPNLYETISKNLASQGLNRARHSDGWRRIIIEKPFGRDLESAKELNKNLQDTFSENQIYRIDHYLGKETVQNILAFRFSNGIFEPIWNRNYVDHVEITSAEYIGVEDRGGYYDHAGALRDMVQNHLLQVLGTIAMEPPSFFNADSVRDETVKVFHSLRPIPIDNLESFVVRGQYGASTISGEQVRGYREEKNVGSDSRTETFVALKTFVDNWRWGGVPFFFRTGKRLPTRVTEVVIHFKKTPHRLFTESSLCDVNCNQLILRIQPDEGILLKIGMKVPGAGFQIQNVNMDFHYADLANNRIPEAYARLLHDCMLGDATLYARSDAVEACWKFITPILEAWESRPEMKIFGYPAGTWGPKEAAGLFGDPSTDWRYPCRNLANDGIYCEL